MVRQHHPSPSQYASFIYFFPPRRKQDVNLSLLQPLIFQSSKMFLSTNLSVTFLITPTLLSACAVHLSFFPPVSPRTPSQGITVSFIRPHPPNVGAFHVHVCHLFSVVPLETAGVEKAWLALRWAGSVSKGGVGTVKLQLASLSD